MVSPSPPPLAAVGLFTAKELNINCAIPVLAKFEFLKKVLLLLIVLTVLASTLAEVPPPVKYLTVKVVLLGAVPYVFVKTKLVGENAVVNLL